MHRLLPILGPTLALVGIGITVWFRDHTVWVWPLFALALGFPVVALLWQRIVAMIGRLALRLQQPEHLSKGEQTYLVVPIRTRVVNVARVTVVITYKSARAVHRIWVVGVENPYFAHPESDWVDPASWIEKDRRYYFDVAYKPTKPQSNDPTNNKRCWIGEDWEGGCCLAAGRYEVLLDVQVHGHSAKKARYRLISEGETADPSDFKLVQET